MTTVRRVLFGDGPVAAATRERVEAALAEMGYVMDAVAQGLRKQKTMTIGHLIHSLVPEPFYVNVAVGVEREASRHGYAVLLYNTHADAENEAVGVRTLSSRRVDAVIFTQPIDPANVAAAVQEGFPLVEIVRPTQPDTAYIALDFYGGARAAMTHLLDLGHRAIGYIGSNPDSAPRPSPGFLTPEAQVMSAYQDTLRESGLDLRDELIVLGDYNPIGATTFEASGYTYAECMLSVTPRPTALLVGSDMLAAGVLQAMYANGIRVPEEMSLIGFTDSLAAFLTPPLTTVRAHMLDVGAEAARLALSQLGEVRPPTGSQTMDMDLVIRQSTGRPPDRHVA